jgi:hypothetical protein
MYKYDKYGSTIRLSDGATISPFEGSPERQEVIAWVALGNTIAPADPPSPQEQLKSIESAIETHMDQVAQAKRYDNRDSCRLYAGYQNPFQAEAIAYGQWVANCWLASNAAQADVLAGLRTIPTPEEAVLELPEMVWPI